MGNKLESVRTDLEKVEDIHQDSLEMAQEDAEEMRDIRDILREIPQDIDSDLLERVEDVSDQSTQEGVDDMETNVHGRLEEGHELADETSEVSSEQQELSEDTAGGLENVSDTRFSGGAADAASEAHDTGEQFEEVNDQAQESVENTDAEYEKFLSEVQG